ncbi:MAG: 4Fe-4S binding protein, partial [Crenarchaeota archaeon]|nr:4Fe-4S binding protein [Thermoproteota archaeon]
MAVFAIFMGLLLGPFNQPLWQPLGISPRDRLIGIELLGSQFPDGLSIPVLACYYPNGRTVTCPIWQIQAYIFPFWDYYRGYEVYYSTTGLEKLLVVFGSITALSLVLGRTFCGWLCPMGLYMDALTKARKFAKKKHFVLSSQTNNSLKQFSF